jgi:hypothetical protein
MSDFWRTWLKGWSLYLAAFGVLFALIDLRLIGMPAQLFNDWAFLRLFSGTSAPLTPDLAVANGVLGAMLIGWGLFMYYAVDPMSKDDAAPLRRAIGMSMTAWFLFDQAASWRGGAYGNMITNLLFYGVFMLPLLLGAAQREPVRRTA